MRMRCECGNVVDSADNKSGSFHHFEASVLVYRNVGGENCVLATEKREVIVAVCIDCHPKDFLKEISPDFHINSVETPVGVEIL